MISSIVLAVALGGAAEAEAPVSPRDQAAAYMEAFEHEYGRWDVTNWVMSAPGEYQEIRFTIVNTPVFDGLGYKTDWIRTESGEWFGVVLRTYNPQTEQIDQHYFAADRSAWSSITMNLELYDDGHGVTSSGEDQYGVFNMRSRTTYLPDGAGYDWTIERRYEGTDWFLVDRGEARPPSDTN